MFTLVSCSALHRAGLSSSSKLQKVLLLNNISVKDFITRSLLLHHLPSYNSLSALYHLSKMDTSFTNHKTKSPKRFQCPEINEMTGEPCTVTSDRRFNIERHCSTMHTKSKASPISSIGSSRPYAQSSGSAPLAQMKCPLAPQTNPEQGEEQDPASADKSIPSETTTRQLHPIPETLSDTSPTAQVIHTMPAGIK